MKSRLTTVLTCTCLASLVVSGALAAERSTRYTNHSEKTIYVEEVLCDGMEFFSCGVLIPGSTAGLDEFPKLADEYVVSYREGRGAPILQNRVDGRGLRQRMKTVRRGANVTMHFVFTTQARFEVKLEERLPKEDLYDGKLWPDEHFPAFGLYQKLASAAYSRDMLGVPEAIAAGAPDFWPNDPRGMTPLEWTVRWGNRAEFELLIGRLPKDYPHHRLVHCVELAVKGGSINFLKRLLLEPSSRQITKHALEEIFYHVCSSPSAIEALPLLLAAYSVDVNFRVRDYGHTMLFIAAENGNVRLVEWLLANGADRFAKLENGETALSRAKSAAVRELLMP